MVPFIKIKTNELDLQPNLRIMKSKDYMIHMYTRDLIDDAKDKAHIIKLEAQQDYELEKKRGYDNGLELSKQESSSVILEI